MGCAFLGSGTGICVGTAVGGTTGAVGYGVYEKRAEIRKGADKCTKHVKSTVGGVIATVQAKTRAAKTMIFCKSNAEQGPKLGTYVKAAKTLESNCGPSQRHLREGRQGKIVESNPPLEDGRLAVQWSDGSISVVAKESIEV